MLPDAPLLILQDPSRSRCCRSRDCDFRSDMIGSYCLVGLRATPTAARVLKQLTLGYYVVKGRWRLFVTCHEVIQIAIDTNGLDSRK